MLRDVVRRCWIVYARKGVYNPAPRYDPKGRLRMYKTSNGPMDKQGLSDSDKTEHEGGKVRADKSHERE